MFRTEDDRPAAPATGEALAPSEFPWLPLVAIVVVVLVAYGEALQFPLLGHDTYPLIASSRLGGEHGGVGRLFGEELMAGRFRGGFYRPLTSLSFALDHAVWGLQARGYQLTNLLALAACGGALFLLLRRLCGAERWVAPIVGALVFALHPAQWELLPIASRRADTLSCCFVLLCVRAALAERNGAVFAAVFALLGMACKENAFLAPVFVFAAGALTATQSGLRQRGSRGVRLAWPVALAAALAFGARAAVLGGLGGYEGAGVAAWPVLRDLAPRLAFPQPAMVAGWAGPALLVGLVLALVGWRRLGRGSAASRAGATAWLGTIWIAAALLLAVAIRQAHAWYLLYPVAGFALLVGAAADALGESLRRDRGTRRALAAVAAALLATLVLWQASYVPLLRRYVQLELAAEAQNEFLGDLDRRIAAAAPGDTLVTLPLPEQIRAAHEGPKLYGVFVLQPYTVEAWAELRFPNTALRFARPDDGAKPPAADEILVLLTPEPKRRLRQRDGD